MTTAEENSEWPIHIRSMPPRTAKIPFSNGTSGNRSKNQLSNAKPSMTSGVTITRNSIVMNATVHFPGRRTSATPASPPMITAINVEPIAALNELISVSRSGLLSSSSRYHLSPPNSFQMLKLLPPFIEWRNT